MTKTRFEVSVTEEDINNGVPGDPNYCPIALAIQRIFPNFGVMVGKDRINLEFEMNNSPGFYCIGTTYSQYRFVRRFDKGKSVQPFNFWISDPMTLDSKKYEDFEDRLAKSREKAMER